MSILAHFLKLCTSKMPHHHVTIHKNKQSELEHQILQFEAAL